MKRFFFHHKEFFLAFLAILFVLFLTRTDWGKQNNDPVSYQFTADVDQYYSYLVAFEIAREPSFKFTTNRGYWLWEHESGALVQKMTLGMSIMYAPFFYIGDMIALNSKKYKADGYSYPYSAAVRAGTWFYVFLGLFFLFKTLAFLFNKSTAAITVFFVFIGTNLVYYTMNEGEMTHSYLFSLFSIFIFCVIKLFETKRVIYLLPISFILGLSILIRPTSVLIVLFPLLYGGFSIYELKNKLALLISSLPILLVSIFLFALPIFLQLLYWKVYTGDWVVYSYNGEKFFFNNPKILDFLIGFRKGWFIYTPIMIVGIIGLFTKSKALLKVRWSIVMILILAVYILSSWWCWWFGGGLGSRSMIDYYAFIAIPFAAAIFHFMHKKYINVLLASFLLITTAYNLVLQRKYPESIHWDGMTKDAWVISMSNLFNMDDKAREEYAEALELPDYKAAIDDVQKVREQ